MARKMQYNEDIAWARLHKKTQERNKGKTSPLKLILLCLGILLVLAMVGITAHAPSSHTQYLTLPETVTIHPVVVAAQAQVEGEEFVQGLENTGIQVSVSYDAQKLGQQEVVLTFTRGNEVCTQTAELYLFHLEPSLTFSGDEKIELNIRDYVPDESIEAEFITAPKLGASGVFDLQVLCAGKEYTVQYIVTESLAPKGTGKEVKVEADTIPDASVFVDIV